MKAEVTISELYNHDSLRHFFFRDQSWDTFVELMSRSEMDISMFLSELDDATDDMNIDEVEEMFYEYDVESLAEEFNIELENEGEDDEDE